MSDLTSTDRVAALVSAYSILLEFDEGCTYLNAWTDDPTLFARPAEEMMGKTIDDVLGGAGARFSDAVRRVAKTGVAETLEYSLDVVGGRRWFLADLKRAVENGAPRVVFVARDITERKRAEEALRLSEERFRLIAQAASDVIWDWDVRKNIVRWNDAIESVFGYPSEPTTSQWWVERVHPADRERVAHDIHGFLERRDPSTWKCEYRWTRSDGSIAEVSDRGRLLFGEDGSLSAFVGAMTDLTEKKRLQQQLIHSDRLAALGTLSAGVAHEINNPLSFILSNAHFADRELESIRERVKTTSGDAELLAALDGVVEALADLRTGADRVSVIVRDLKHFCHADDAKTEPLDVRSVLDRALALVGTKLRHRLTVGKSYGEVPLVRANAAKLGQVFLNLFINAEQAMTHRDPAENRLVLATRVDSAGRVVVEVADTGCGMTGDVLSRVFDPFFTTKDVGAGTGLGLSICHGIVTALGGEIEAESTPGAGSRFRVILPPMAPVERPSARDARRDRSAIRVLVIDDETRVLSGLRRALSLEHNVDTMGSAEDALAALREGRSWDVILCDLMMPGMTGMDFHREVSQSHPAVLDRLFFLTGGAVTDEAREFEIRIGERLLSKSMSIDDLKKLLEREAARRTSDV